MPALISIDCEFTHGSPMHGALMSWAAVAVEFDPATLRMGADLGVIERHFRVADGNAQLCISPWVRQNQADLLRRCRDITINEDKAARTAIQIWLRQLKLQHGTLYPGGWCMQNDLMYTTKEVLTDFEDGELLHYTGYDIQPLSIAAFGPLIAADDAVLINMLDCSRVDAEHDALGDALFQTSMLRALFKRISRPPNGLVRST